MIDAVVAIMKSALVGALIAIALFVIAPMLNWQAWLGLGGFVGLFALAAIWQMHWDEAARKRAECLAQLDEVMRRDR